MAKTHDVNEQTKRDMANSRQNATLNIQRVREFIHNGAEKWERRKKVVDVLQSDPMFEKSQRDFMSRTERYNRGLRMINRLFELEEANNWSQHDMSAAFGSLDESLPIGLHFAAFQPVLLSQGGPGLVAKYGRLAATRGIIGCYLQTELGHGTNVSSLETTATYIPETKEFEIHSPTLTSSKWWIGSLGKTSTHGVVQAKLILPGGKDVGPHLFLIQLRSLVDHKVLPGIVIGDIGPKAMGGYSPTDSGFARFTHVRIPKENMLSRFAQVTNEGQYVQPPHAKLSYGGMLYIRAGMVTAAGWQIAKAATVSIRYATVRRQGEKGPDGLERQIINYPSVYYRLLPILSRAYVFIQLGRNLSSSFDMMATRLAAGDTSLLAEMHATTSGLKVLVSSTGVQDLETARRSMGGHGYSAFAGLGRLYADYAPSVTYEGDNFVLDQQVVRATLKSHRNLLSSKSPSISMLSPSSHYLRLLLQSGETIPNPDTTTLQDPENIIKLLEWRAALLVREHAQNVEEHDGSVNQRISKAVTEAFVAAQVGKMISSITLPGPSPVKLSGNDTEIISGVYRLYLLTTLESGITDLLSFNILPAKPAGSSSQDITRSLRLTIKSTCETLLSEAIALTDAFGFTDWELDSALGVYHGNVYEELWKRAQMEPLNLTEVPAAYQESIRPILERGQKRARLSKL